jgi:PleD family two-component response regulator
MRDDDLKKRKILVADDQEANVLLLERFLERSGYTNVLSTTDSRQVLPLYHDFQPDLIVLDLLMPHLDGYAIMERLATEVPEETYLPILVLTADNTSEAMHRALSMGAKDFLQKPFDPVELILRIRNLLETRILHQQVRDRNLVLEAEVNRRTEELQRKLDQITELAEHRRALLSQISSSADLAAIGDSTRAG